jgi:hypothetical protein
MFLEGLTVCVNYADYLSIALTRNLCHFDRFIVVTVADDLETQFACSAANVEVVITHRLHHNAAVFNKGCALNDGLAKLSRTGWIALLDADIVLPANFRQVVLGIKDQTEILFSCKRRICTSYSAWKRYGEAGDFDRFMETKGDQMLFRAFGPAATGYLAVFSCAASALNARWPWCNERFVDASRVDVDFAGLWGTTRQWLPFPVVHLGEVGVNWRGRRSDPFFSAEPA